MGNHIKLPRVQDNEITSQLQATASKLELLRQATKKDNELELLKHVLQKG